jgi:hypothetical protein
MATNIRKPTEAVGSVVPVLLGGLFVLATILFIATIARPAIAQAAAAYLAVLVIIVMAASTWVYARTNQQTLQVSRETLMFARAEAEANRPRITIDVAKAWFDITVPSEATGEERTSVLIHLRAAFTNCSKTVPTTVTVKAAFVGEELGDNCGTLGEIIFFRNPRPHQLTVSPADTVECTLLISGETVTKFPDSLEIELRFSHPFEDQLQPLRVVCPRLGAPTGSYARGASSDLMTVGAPQ